LKGTNVDIARVEYTDDPEISALRITAADLLRAEDRYPRLVRIGGPARVQKGNGASHERTRPLLLPGFEQPRRR
jgi:hypothetical protein